MRSRVANSKIAWAYTVVQPPSLLVNQSLTGAIRHRLITRRLPQPLCVWRSASSRTRLQSSKLRQALCSSMTLSLPGPLVDVGWVQKRLFEPSLKLLDATWYLPGSNKDPKAEFQARRIPGSQYFDIDAVADSTIPLPHMLPSAQVFSAACDALNIRNSDTVVVYDRSGIFAAPRAWWMFRVMGHTSVAVLDGGLPAWEAAGATLDTTEVAAEQLEAAACAARLPAAATMYNASLQVGAVKGLQDMLNIVQQGSSQPGSPLVVDARPAARFYGTQAEPRAGMRSGHMPGAVNVPFPDMLADGRLKSPAELRGVFASKGVDPGKQPLVLSCGTGVTACGVRLGLAVAYPEADQGYLWPHVRGGCRDGYRLLEVYRFSYPH